MVDGFGVFGAFEGFAVLGFRVREFFLVGTNEGPLLTGQSVGFLVFGLFVGSCAHPLSKGEPVGQEIGEAGTKGTEVGESVDSAVGLRVGEGVCFAVGTAVGWYVGEGVGWKVGEGVGL